MIIKGKLAPLRKGILAGHAGLGDTVAVVAEKTGIAALTRCVEKATGRPCGCRKRREKLNHAVPYRDAGEGAAAVTP